MAGVLAPILDERGGGALLVVAAPAEAGAVLEGRNADPVLRDVLWKRIPVGDRVDMIVTGVGKANAGAATARLLDPERDAVVLSLGIGGALPDSGLTITSVVLATRSVMADEGLATPEWFRSSEALGFPARLGPGGAVGDRMGVDADPALLAALRPLADREAVVATVSTAAGTDALAMAVVSRTGAAAEAMEGAAVGLTAANLSFALGSAAPAFCEARVVSNTTGDRERQRWGLREALARLRELAAAL